MRVRPSDGCVWITGGSSGIGRALASLLLREGWTVVISARDETKLLRTKSDLGGAMGRLETVTLDVSSGDEVVAAVRHIESNIAPIALAILNAGTHRPVRAESLDVACFKELVAVNLMGTVYSLAAVLEGMRKRRRGHIAVVASLAGYVGLPTAAAYGMTKAGLINMCEALKPELERMDIALQIVNPGFVRTPLTDQNRFPMPFLMEVDAAAKSFHRGLLSRRFEIVFPWRFAILVKLLRMLPYWAVWAITRRLEPFDQP